MIPVPRGLLGYRSEFLTDTRGTGIMHHRFFQYGPWAGPLTMRREGYEFQVSRPRIIPREGPHGERLEPYEELMIDCPEGYLGVVMEKLGPRRAELLDMRNPGVGTVRMRFKIPARWLRGYRSEFLTDTRGTGIMHHRFFQYGPWAGPLSGRRDRKSVV